MSKLQDIGVLRIAALDIVLDRGPTYQTPREKVVAILDLVDRHLAALPPGSAAPCTCPPGSPADVVSVVCPMHGEFMVDPSAPPGSAVAGAPRPVSPWPTLLEDLDEAADWWQECGRHSDAARLRRRATLIRARFENWEIAKSSRLPLGPESAHAMLVVTAVNEEDPRPPVAPPDSAAKGPTK